MLSRWMLFCGLVLLTPLAVAENDLRQFQESVAKMVELRSTAYQFAQANGIVNQRKPKLTREQSNQIREMSLRYLQLRGPLLAHSKKVADLFASRPQVILSTEHPTGEMVREATLNQGMSIDMLPPRQWVNPNDRAGQQQLFDIQLGLAAALVLMDSYQIAVQPYAQNPELGYVLTYDVDSAHSLRNLERNYHSSDYRSRLGYATRFVDDYMSWRRSQGLATSAEESYLYTLSQSTLWYVSLRKNGGSSADDMLRYLAHDLDLQKKHLKDKLSFGLSLGFGNMVGLVQTRKGKLTHVSAEERDQLARELKPLDILLEKTPFRLTDKMIPGHYGHVAIWLGSEEDLRALGVWEQIAPKYQQQIRNGGRIVEALRSGVTISTLEHFLNIDDFLALRDRRPVDDQYRRTAILTTLKQVGKEYDFNFDVLTHKRIVCSELAYVVFPDVQWPLDRTLGRYTLSPDNVAQLAMTEKPVFSPVVIYRDGTRVKTALEQTLAALVAKP